MSSSVHYAVKDRDGKITQEPGKKDAKRDQKAYGGLIVRSKGEGEYKHADPTGSAPGPAGLILGFFLGLIGIVIMLWLPNKTPGRTS